MMKLKQQKGIALIMVLWVISGLTMIISAAFINSRIDTQLSITQINLAQAHGLAEAGIYQGIYALLQPRQSIQMGVPEYPPKLSWSAANVEIQIRNESGKIDVNEATDDLIEKTLVYAGIERSKTQEIMSLYRRSNQLNGLRNEQGHKTFSSTEDFARSLGIGDHTWSRIGPWLTVHNGQPSINPDSADESLLELFLDKDLSTPDTEQASSDSLEHRTFNRMNGDNQYLTERLSSVYSINARAYVGQVSVLIEAIVKMSANNKQPYTILVWRESPTYKNA